MIQLLGAIFWRDAGINSARDSHSALWGFSSIECTSVVHSLLWSIVGLNECTFDNIQCGFEHHLKWLSPKIVHYLRLKGAISDTATVGASCAAIGLSRFIFHLGTQHSSLEIFINMLLFTKRSFSIT